MIFSFPGVPLTRGQDGYHARMGRNCGSDCVSVGIKGSQGLGTRWDTAPT